MCDTCATTENREQLKSFHTKVIDMDYIPYDRSWELMRRLVPFKTGRDLDDVLILTECEPVFTLGRRGTESDIIAPKALLESKGIGIRKVERGGMITYHGPGQLLAYPVFNVNRMGLSPSRMVNGLEEAILNVLDDFSIKANRVKGRPGVWIGENLKIASLGVAVRRGISFHGLALNYDPDLGHFALINPCGFTGIRMTSMAEVLSEKIDPTVLKASMLKHLARIFSLDHEPWTLEQAEDWVKDIELDEKP